MKFICDVHIPIKLSKYFVSCGFESQHMTRLLRGDSTTDSDICQYADATDSIVITKDSDFKNSYLLRQTPKKLIRVCLGNIPNESLMDLLAKHLPLIERLNRNDAFYVELHPNNILVFS
ncbi:DUF5615 family PIN-like protein [Spirosoma soli]|uniref:DUF5615 family PIN-like protein n=1 Tax=Spirosoma soli TaxID=1770529 RepID=A0ABW5LYL6_9BACT